MKNYHAHIYFALNQKPEAEFLATSLLPLDPLIRIFKTHENKVGPHALPMIEVHFSEIHLENVVRILSEKNKNLSILVHEDSGDDFKDHESPIWVGRPLPIDFNFFHQVKANPSLSVH